MSDQNGNSADGTTRQPIFMIPGVIVALVGIMVAIHLASTLVLNQRGFEALVTWFGFLPGRISAPGAFPGGLTPLLWTPVTYAFLHAGWEHLLGNVVWLVIFGTPLARRYGVAPTLAIFLLSSIVGALAFAVTDFGTGAVLIGASGGIAGFTGAAIRFVFQPMIVARHPITGQLVPLGRKLASVREVLHNGPARNLAALWIVLNCVVPLLPLVIGLQIQIAWQAHLGGFVAGFLLVRLFDKSQALPQAAAPDESEGDPPDSGPPEA